MDGTTPNPIRIEHPQGLADCRFSIDLDGFSKIYLEAVKTANDDGYAALVQNGLEHWPFLSNNGALQFSYAHPPQEGDLSLGIRPLYVKGPFNLQNMPKLFRSNIGPHDDTLVLIDIDIRGSHSALMACMSGCAPMIEACKGDLYSCFGGGAAQRTANKLAWNAFINGAGLAGIEKSGHPDPAGFLDAARGLAAGEWRGAFRWLDLGAARCIDAGLATPKNARALYLQRVEALTMFRALTVLCSDKERVNRWQLSIVLVNHDGLLLSCLPEYALEALAMARELLSKAITNEVSPDVAVWTKGALQTRWGVDLEDGDAPPPTGMNWSVSIRRAAQRWVDGGSVAPCILSGAIDLGAVLKSDVKGRETGRLYKQAIEKKARAIAWQRQAIAKASGFPLVEASGKVGSYNWLRLVLSQDKSFPVLRYDIRANVGRIGGALVDDRAFRSLFFDGLANRYGFYAEADNGAVGIVVEDIGYEDHQYDPVLDWFNALPAWDGTPRAATWVEKYCSPRSIEEGKDGKNPYINLYNTYGLKFLLSLIARTYKPGCEVHTSLILSGAQGTGKTSLFKMIAPDGSYAAKSIDPGNKDCVTEVSRYALVEWGELSGLKKADMERIKDYWSATYDEVRTPYARRSIRLERRGVICGSDNSGAIFVDPTGGRRFWVVPNGSIDLDGLEAVVRQLWAEALVLYRAGHQWHLTSEEEAVKDLSDMHFTPSDPWAEKVGSVIKEKVLLSGEGLTISNLCEALDVRIEQREVMAKNLAKTLRKMGYDHRRAASGDRVRYWFNPKENKPATNQEVPEQ